MMQFVEGLTPTQPQEQRHLMESPTKKTTAAVLAGLTASGAAGAMLFAPGVSFAVQEDDSTDAADTPAAEAPAADEAGARAGHRGERLTNLAEILGIEQDALKTALQDGQSIAEIAEANGVDVDTVVDQLVDDATARLEERIAGLPEHMDDLVNGELERPHRPGFGGRDGGPSGETADDEGN